MVRRDYAYCPSWVFVFFALGVVPGALARAMFSKHASLEHPLCAECMKRWSLATTAWTLSVVGPVVLGLLAMAFAAMKVNGDALLGLGVALVVGLVAAPLIVHYTFVVPRTLRAVEIDDAQLITLKGAAPEALAALSARPHWG
jgi:hypothetical protein